MQPTMKLRFVEREIEVEVYVDTDDRTVYTQTKKVRVLQQWWEYRDRSSIYNAASLGEPNGKWRDVPLEVEE